MLPATHAQPLYRQLASWFCLPSFTFLLGPVLAIVGEAGVGWSIVAVLTSVWVAPMFTLLAMAVALVGHYSAARHIGERRMWTLIVLAITANLLLSAGGLACRILR